MGEQFLFPLLVKMNTMTEIQGKELQVMRCILFFCSYCGFCMEAVGICQPQAQTRARKKTKKPKHDSTSLTTENPWQGYPGTVKALEV